MFSTNISNDTEYNPSLNINYSEEVPQNLKYSSSVFISAAIAYEQLGNTIDDNLPGSNSGWSISMNSIGSRFAVGSPLGQIKSNNSTISPGFVQVRRVDSRPWPIDAAPPAVIVAGSAATTSGM